MGLQEAVEGCDMNRVTQHYMQNFKALRNQYVLPAIIGRPSIIAPNKLHQEFTVDQPNTSQVMYMTYIRTWQS
jgi:hypothetical protein